ncbi:MAG: putative Ig domain-containing protein [Bryobacterales bacterium]|nr:putative Ig domain-containing protein [Bryobacterales bacterium]
MRNFIAKTLPWVWLAVAAPAMGQVNISAPAPGNLTPAMVNRAYNVNFSATGGPVTWSLGQNDTLPAGLSLSSQGTISGTPLSTTGSPFSFTITATNGPASDSKNYSLTVLPELSIATNTLPNGIVSTAYSFQMTGTGGSGGPYQWSATGLPASLSIGQTTGIISGTQTTPVSVPVTITVQDTVNPQFTANKNFTLTITGSGSPPTIGASATLPAATQNRAYNFPAANFQVTGGTTPYTFSIDPPNTPPAGITLDSSGLLSGAPSGTGTSNFTVRVRDAAFLSATKTFTLTVNAPPSISTTTIPSGTVGTPYPSTTLIAANGTVPLTWSMTGAPAWLLLNTGTGVLSGTPDAAVNTNINVTVTDANGGTGTKQLALVVAGGLTITTSSLPPWTAGIPYSQTLASSGGAGSIAWALQTGSTLPANLGLSSAGVLSGIPSAAGTSSFTVQATDATPTTVTKALTLTINAAPAVSTSSLPGGALNVAYSTTLTATGGTAPLVWSATGLPAGLGLNPNSGVLSGTPTATGTSQAALTVTDSAGAFQTKTIALTVSATGLAITTNSLPNGALNSAYSTTLGATGGSGTGYTWAISIGSLPAGLTLQSATGAISGTPTAAGSSVFTVLVTDSAQNTASKQFSITVVSSSLTITTVSPLPQALAGNFYITALQASGGSGTGYQWSLAQGALPTGLNLNVGGTINGTPSGASTSAFTVQVIDSLGTIATKAVTLMVVTQALSIATVSPLPDASQNVPYSTVLAASGGTGSGYTFQVASGQLPAGLSLAPGGVISGTPTVAGPVTFTVQVADNGGGVATKPLTLTVVAPNLTITSSTTLPSAPTNQAYSTLLTASGGTQPYTWSVTVGTLPSGLTLNPTTGVISGTPTNAGLFNFTVQVKDTHNLTASANLSLQVVTFAITTQSLAQASLNTTYSATLTAVGGSPPYTWSILSGTLPQGLTLSAGTGQISGTPAQSGTFPFTAQVRDSVGATASTPLSLVVGGAGSLTILTASLPNATLNVLYSQTLQVSGGTGPYTWVVTEGALPVGLTLSGGTGVISGTPQTTVGSPYSFVIRVTDSAGASTSRLFTIAIASNNALTITTASPLPNASPNAGYSQTIQASGGTPPYLFSLIGTLPLGFNLGTNGSLGGTTTQTGSFTFNVQVTDANNQTATKAFTLTVGTPSQLTISTAALPNGTVGTAYSAPPLAATGGTPPYTWTATGLPAGLSLSTTGNLSGTPTAAGTFSVTVQVTDSASQSITKALSITITAATLTIATPPLINGTVGVPYSAALSATGGSGTGYIWALMGGQLPPGINSNISGGLISGTPVTAGTFTFTIQVTDSTGGTASKQFTITISAAGFTILTTTPPNGTVNTAYSYNLVATGGTGTLTWVVVPGTGSLPAGVLLTAAGLLTGTPGQTGVYTFTVQVTDTASRSVTQVMSITVVAAGFSIVTTTLPVATIGVNYSFPIQQQGGTAPITWSITGGQLPAGLGLVPNSGLLTGLPTLQAITSIIITATDSAGKIASKTFTLTVNPQLTVSTTSLPGGSLGQVYSQTLFASGGSGSGYIWSLQSGTLPAGLTLASATGVISGTPAANGNSSFTVQVADSAGGIASKLLSITIGTSLSIATEALPNAATNVPYNQTIAAAGGSAPLQWSVTGSLPVGLTLNAATGAISGTPTAAGISTFTVRVQDAAGASASKQFSITVTEGLQITTPTALPNAAEGSTYTQTLAATGGKAPYTWTISVGSLPDGLALAPTSGLITGTPTAAGNYSFIIQVADSQTQTVQKAFTLSVTGRINITTGGVLPSATVRQAYNQTLVATGGTPPYSWSLAAGGTPPLGLTLDKNGVLSGTPSSAGAFNFTAQVTDSQNISATRTFTLSVLLNLSITTPQALPPATAGTAYAQPLAAAGGLPPYTWSVTDGSLPAGVSLTSGGILSGTPAAAGNSAFTVQVADNNKATASASFQLAVRLPGTPPLTITGLPETVNAALQPRVSLSIGAPFPVPITGTLTLTFTPDAAVPTDDPAVVFTNGKRSADFTIPANSTAAQLPDGFAMQTGTVAGTLTLAVSLKAGSADITPNPAPMLVSKVNRAAPLIKSVTARRVNGGLEVAITGYATGREITSATFRFTPASGSTLQTTELTVQLGDSAKAWYQSEASKPFGSQFTLTQQFNVQGDTSAISSVTVTMTNPQGTSTAVTANFQ